MSLTVPVHGVIVLIQLDIDIVNVPSFRISRDRIPRTSFAQLEFLDPCTLEHGWFLQHQALEQFRKHLIQAPDLSNAFLCLDIAWTTFICSQMVVA